MKKIVLAVVLIGLSITSYPQKNDSLRSFLVKSIEKSASKSFDRKDCNDFNPVIFSVFINFSQKGLLENTFVSDCSCVSKDLFIHELNLALKKLKADSFLKNRFIISMVYVTNDSKKDSLQPLFENWESIFNGVAMDPMFNKKLLFSLPVAISIIPRISN